MRPDGLYQRPIEFPQLKLSLGLEGPLALDNEQSRAVVQVHEDVRLGPAWSTLVLELKPEAILRMPPSFPLKLRCDCPLIPLPLAPRPLQGSPLREGSHVPSGCPDQPLETPGGGR